MSEDTTGLPPLVKVGKDTFGWIGIDLDGTLAYYDGWHGATHIGDPIAPMHALVLAWLQQGRDVRIVSARVNPATTALDDIRGFKEALGDWCERWFGRRLPVTCSKDLAMAVLYDDRCVQVETNTGRVIRDLESVE